MKLTFKSPEIVVRAVKAGLTVYWRNTGYRVTEGMQIVHHSGSSEGAHWPPHDMSKIFAYVSQDTEDFLTTLLFCNEPEDWDEDEDEPPFNADMHNRTIYDFAPEFVAAVEAFISGFRETLGNTDLDMLSRSFGGNVFLSLSGHGAGFWDDSHPWGGWSTTFSLHTAGTDTASSNSTSPMMSPACWTCLLSHQPGKNTETKHSNYYDASIQQL